MYQRGGGPPARVVKERNAILFPTIGLSAIPLDYWPGPARPRSGFYQHIPTRYVPAVSAVSVVKLTALGGRFRGAGAGICGGPTGCYLAHLIYWRLPDVMRRGSRLDELFRSVHICSGCL